IRKRAFLSNDLDGFSQQFPILLNVKQRSSLVRHDRKEICPARHIVPAIFRHCSAHNGSRRQTEPVGWVESSRPTNTRRGLSSWLVGLEDSTHPTPNSRLGTPASETLFRGPDTKRRFAAEGSQTGVWEPGE